MNTSRAVQLASIFLAVVALSACNAPSGKAEATHQVHSTMTDENVIEIRQRLAARRAALRREAAKRNATSHAMNAAKPAQSNTDMDSVPSKGQ